MATWRPSWFFFSKDQLDTKEILCVEFQNSDISSFRGDAGTTIELTEIDENSKWPPFFHFRFYVKSVDTLQERKITRNTLVKTKCFNQHEFQFNRTY